MAQADHSPYFLYYYDNTIILRLLMAALGLAPKFFCFRDRCNTLYYTAIRYSYYPYLILFYHSSIYILR